jgi:hypothetical protein
MQSTTRGGTGLNQASLGHIMKAETVMLGRTRSLEPGYTPKRDFRYLRALAIGSLMVVSCIAVVLGLASILDERAEDRNDTSAKSQFQHSTGL